MDFRKADPKFINFVPRTCVEAIGLFVRHRNLGMQPNLYPECMIHCARKLPDAELDKFYRWIVCPDGDITGGEGPSATDAAIEAERQQLVREAEGREQKALTIVESPQEEEKMSFEEMEMVNELEESYSKMSLP